MAQIRAAAQDVACVIDADEQLDTCIARRNRSYIELMATQRRKGHRWTKGRSVQELTDLLAQVLREMGYDDDRQRAHGVTVDTLRKFAT